MGLVVTDLGRERIMAHFGAGTELVIDEVRVGTLTAAQRYDALANAVAMVDATPTVYAGTAPMISGVSAQYNVQLSGADEVDASEIGLFEGSNLIILWANQAADLFNKPANGNVLFAVGWSLADGDISNVTVTIQPYPLADEADARARTRNDVLMTPLRVGQAVAQWWIGIGTKLNLRNIISMATPQAGAEWHWRWRDDGGVDQ